MSVTLTSPVEYRRLADRLRGLPAVVGVDVLEHDPRLDRAALEIVVGPGLERVPPAVVRVLGNADVGIRDVTSRPEGHFVVLAV